MNERPQAMTRDFQMLPSQPDLYCEAKHVKRRGNGGQIWTCELVPGHQGPHESGVVRWTNNHYVKEGG